MKRSYAYLMKVPVLFSIFILAMGFQCCSDEQVPSETVEMLKKKLYEISEKTDNNLFANHLESIILVINSEKHITEKENQLLERMYDAFLNDTLANPSEFDSYIDRRRMLILAWVSPTDSAVSFAWLRLPNNWDPEMEYPLYVHLHGYWDVASKPISFMSYTFVNDPMTSPAFEDGYFLSPWGRGNKWYHGMSKTDIWESIAELEKVVKTDSKRKYLCGHSMGGYGTWHIAQESANTWAAIGIHSGALGFNDSKFLTPEYANNLKNTPTYFVWGDKETEFGSYNLKAHKLLEESGNKNLKITIFNGGHDYNDPDVENMYYWLRTFKKE